MIDRMTMGTFCSGIGAPEVAYHGMFEPLWFSEIEAFPSAVLAHHWPDVPNLGDMTAPDVVTRATALGVPDIVVAGLPCQPFSVAGLRLGENDPRNLTSRFVEIADDFDKIRKDAGRPEPVYVIENVPGLLSSKDNAFGCFLAGLAGEDVPLLPPGKRWTNAGLVLGPKRAVAWRVLDAQYFGLAQRRRRVFVVASARDGFDPSAVLLEFDGLRRDSAPSREAGQSFTHDVAPSLTQSGRGVERAGDTRGQDPVVATPYHEVAHCLNAGGMGRIDYETESFVVNAAIPILEPGARTGKSTTDVRAGLGVGDDGDPMYTLQAGKQHGVACVPVSPTLRAGGNSTGGDRPPGTDVDTADSLICVSVTGDIARTLNTANNGKGCSEDGTGRGVPTIAHTVALRGREGGATAEVGGEVATALRASSGGGDKPHVLTTMDVAGTMKACAGTSGGWSNSADHAAAGYMQVDHNMAVRRLTPTECERLQGFPDGHTDVPYRNKPAADGPRYKALGNSMAVPCMRWIGDRIQRYLNGDL